MSIVLGLLDTPSYIQIHMPSTRLHAVMYQKVVESFEHCLDNGFDEIQICQRRYV